MVKHFLRDEIPGNIRGIENDVARIVAHTPVDSTGRPNFRHWKENVTNTSSASESVLTYKKVMSAKFDLNEKTFPGLPELTEGIERKVFEDLKNGGAGINEMVRVTKYSRNTVLDRMKRYGLSNRETH